MHRESTRHPPSGMRSAVPLGGLGTGSFELRADGTIHEWTLENQSPGGSARYKGTLTQSVPENLRKIDSRLKVSYCAKRLMVVLPN